MKSGNKLFPSVCVKLFLSAFALLVISSCDREPVHKYSVGQRVVVTVDGMTATGIVVNTVMRPDANGKFTCGYRVCFGTLENGEDDIIKVAEVLVKPLKD